MLCKARGKTCRAFQSRETRKLDIVKKFAYNQHMRVRGEEPPPNKDAAPASLSEARVHEIVNGAFKRVETQVIPSLLKPIEERQTTFLADLTAKLDSITKTPDPGGDKSPSDKDKNASVSPDVAARIHSLEQQSKRDADKLAKLEQERVNAENRSLNTEKESKIRSVLAEFSFVSKDAADDVFSIVERLIVRNEANELISEEGGLPVDVFLRDFIPSKKAHFLAPAGKSGSGATPGSTRDSAGKVNIEDIKPGMSQAELAKAAAAIRQAIT